MNLPPSRFPLFLARRVCQAAIKPRYVRPWSVAIPDTETVQAVSDVIALILAAVATRCHGNTETFCMWLSLTTTLILFLYAA